MITPKKLSRQTKIALLMGGVGSENEVSLSSGQGVLNSLRESGFTSVEAVVVTDTTPIIPEGTELCYNMIHGTFGEDGCLQNYLENLGIPYTGAGHQSSKECFDKVLTKKRMVEAGVQTPKSQTMTRDEITAGQKPSIDIPCVVKPPKEGSSFGVHIVKDESQLQAALEDAAQYGEEILIEEYIAGKELTVSILDGQVLPIVHICPRNGFYDLHNKYPSLYGKGATDYICPADLNWEETQNVQDLALQAYKALGVEVYGRVDILLTEEGEAYVLEINTIPGMTSASLFPKAAAAAGINYDLLCARIAQISLKQNRG